MRSEASRRRAKEELHGSIIASLLGAILSSLLRSSPLRFVWMYQHCVSIPRVKRLHSSSLRSSLVRSHMIVGSSPTPPYFAPHAPPLVSPPS